MTKQSSIPKDAVLLIPEPENEHDQPAYGVKPGYYNSKGMLDLLEEHKGNADAVHYIADMLETGDEENDGFAELLKKNHQDEAAIARFIEVCRS